MKIKVGLDARTVMESLKAHEGTSFTDGGWVNTDNLSKDLSYGFVWYVKEQGIGQSKRIIDYLRNHGLTDWDIFKLLGLKGLYR